MRILWEKKSIIVRILDIGIIILSIFFVISLLYAVHSVWEENKYSSYVYEADTFQYRLEDEDYQSMVEMYYSNQATGKANSKKYAEYYAVARYYEAAAMYKAYSEDGDSERAGKLTPPWRKQPQSLVIFPSRQTGSSLFFAGKKCDFLL